MSKHLEHCGRQRSKPQSIAGQQTRWGRPIFGASVEVAFAEHDRRELTHAVWRERSPSREPHFDDTSAADMSSDKACRQGRGVVGDDEIPAAEEIDERRARHVVEMTR